MKRNFFISTYLFLFIFISHGIFAQAVEPLNIYQYKLQNGLTVILNPDPHQSKIFGGVGVKAGSKNDPKEMTGIAHYLEHMLFKGTTRLGTSDYKQEKNYLDRINVMYEELAQTKDEEQRKAIHKKINDASVEAGKYAIPTEFDKLVRSIGGSGLNAFTGEEITFYFNAFPSHQLDKWLDLYSHRFINPVFRLFQSELEVVYEEKNMYNDNFVTAIFELFMKNLYKSHPYGQQTTIGTTEHLKNPSLFMMYNFFNTYYVANNMVLVMSGNFDVNVVVPIIEEKFNRLRAEEVPEFPKYEEQEFNGRELIEARLSPVKIGVMGFRTVPVNHEHEAAIDVCNKILFNNGETGLLNKLILDDKIMFASYLPMGKNVDFGAGIFLFIPKVVGQSLDNAEKLVITEFEKLRKGEFSDALLEACKNEIYTEFLSELEDPQMRTVYLAQAFTQNISMDEFLNYPEKIKSISKQDVISAAEKYYNKNYLVLHSKMGFPKKEKLEKPGYDPIKPNENAVSAYAQEFYNMREREPIEQFVNFSKDFKKYAIKDKVDLYYARNPYNNIYSLTFKIGVGRFENINLPYAAQVMNYAGTSSKTMEEVKTQFHQLGTTYSFSADESYVYIEMDGIEEHFYPAFELLSEIIKTPVIDSKKIKLLVNEEKTARKMEDKEPSEVARALSEYIRKGDKSSYVNRLPLKKISKLKTDKLAKEFQTALLYETEIHYCGKQLSADKVMQTVKDLFPFPDSLKPTKSPVHINDKEINENVVYFLNDKKAIQSQIYFIVNGNAYDIKQAAMYDAFNEYFGGGFSGLVVQEIREYRSMAYATGAILRNPPIQGKMNSFVGYIGTQADKTSEALDVFMGLLKEMPLKTERLDVLKSSLIQETISSRPDFRDISDVASKWLKQGYKNDPGKEKIEHFKNLTFDEIFAFYKSELQQKPVAICIVGDKKRLDMQHIAKYGKIVNVSKKKLYKK